MADDPVPVPAPSDPDNVPPKQRIKDAQFQLLNFLAALLQRPQELSPRALGIARRMQGVVQMQGKKIVELDAPPPPPPEPTP